MEKKIYCLFVVLLISSSAFSQKTQGPYTVTVYKAKSTDCTQQIFGLIDDNDEMDPNRMYIVKVRSTNSPGVIIIDNADGFTVGQLGHCPFLVSSTPTQYASDTGPINNYTITFIIKTFNTPDYSMPIYMRVRESFGGSYTNTQYITFPY